ncbi:hypothetical protein HBD59_004855 [Salmonella enterica]|nr:hypothetical protein [Salmonella enterica]EEU3912552.1 hypothetical protein [Salmonella enterica]EGY4581951.1 hypothetical protein [Salmonella enterica]EGY4586756.1 hypothetical protein [Salmonella enterica]EGY9846196.1 hypothetical protein [Salmonella enterica]
MTTITKERIELFIKSPLENGLTRGEQMELARIALASIDADKPELKIAELINKFYERYPLASFNKDTDRADALGYFLAGAELQCFGEFIKYEELFGDE